MTIDRITTALVLRSFNSHANGVTLDTLAREAGIHPDVARRFVHLGLLEPIDASARPPRYVPGAGATLRRAIRLRRDLGINYSGAVLVSQLLERIAELEADLARLRSHNDQSTK